MILHYIERIKGLKLVILHYIEERSHPIERAAAYILVYGKVYRHTVRAIRLLWVKKEGKINRKC